MAVLMTEPYQTFLDSSGNPLAGGKVFTYETNTTTKKAAYHDQAGEIEHTNPIILDGAGRAQIWLSGTYTIVVKDSDDNTIDTTNDVTTFSTSNGGVDNITGDYTEDTIVAADSFIFADADDSNTTKRDTVQGILDLMSGGLVLLSSQTASSDASIDFTSVLTSTYECYILEISNMVTANDTVAVYLRTSTDNSTFDSGAGNYTWCEVSGVDSNSTVSGLNSTSDTEIQITSNGVGNAAGESYNATVTFYNPLGTNQTLVSFDCSYIEGTGGAANYLFGAGRRASAADVDAFQILASSGNIASGEFKLYGVVKS